MVADQSTFHTSGYPDSTSLQPWNGSCPGIDDARTGSFVLIFHLEHFWSKIFWSPTHCPARARHYLCKSKVCHDNMPFFVQQNILWLQISEGNVETVKVGESWYNLCGVELDRRAGQSLVHPHEGEQFSSTLIGKQEVKIVRVLPAVDQWN